MFDNLKDPMAIEADCWRLLQTAVSDRDCGWRLPILATATDGIPRQRIVVLRSVNPSKRQIFAHTDARSAKVVALGKNPQVSWLFYDAAYQVQLQLNGTATALTKTADTQWLWDQETESSLKGYLAPLAPGTMCEEAETNLPAGLGERIPSREELKLGRNHFAVIQCTPQTAECVILRRSGNQRVTFRYGPEKVIEASWQAP